MEKKETVVLAPGEYLAVIWPTPGKYYGTTHSCHRSIKAARKQAKKMGGKIWVCSNSTPRREVM